MHREEIVEGEFQGLWPGLVPDDDFDADPVPAPWAAPFFIPERTTMLYRQTVTISFLSGNFLVSPAFLADLKSTTKQWYGTRGQPEVTAQQAEQVLDPNARITNVRLREYHARMKDEGYTTSKARHTVIRLALGYDVGVASALKNHEFDKVMAELDG